MASVLGNMGSERAFVVHGHGGMDEISLSGETQVSELSGGSVTTYSISPEQFGFGRSPMESIAGGTVERNAEIIRDVLSGRPGPHRDVTVLNAAFACAASGICAGPQDGVARAEESIDSGAAREKLEKLAAMTNAQA
jgi:anthranilate phosphoribosyltransferase